MIREYREETDRIPLRELFLETRRQTFTWLDVDAFKLEDFEHVTRGEWILVAEVGGRVVGFASVWRPEDFVHSLFVHPDFQGQGLGSLLLDACLAGMGRPASLKCTSRNTRALAFYESRGWVRDREGVASDGPYFLMVLR